MELLRTTGELVLRACSDVRFRRRLRYEPQEALLAYGFSVPSTVTSLPVNPSVVSVTLDAETFYGPSSSHCALKEAPQALRLLLYGVRPAALIFAPPERMPELVAAARACRLHCALSPMEFAPKAEVKLNGYSNAMNARRPARAGGSLWRGVVISADESLVVLGWLSLLFDWNQLLGFVLGYPNCCANAFDEIWANALTKYNGEPTLGIIQRSDPGIFDWRMNIAARLFGYELLEHFPCRMDCLASVQLARHYQGALAAHEPARAGELKRVLRSPLIGGVDGFALLVEASVAHTKDLTSVEFDPNKVLACGSLRHLAKGRNRRIVTSSATGEQPICDERRLGEILQLFDGSNGRTER